MVLKYVMKHGKIKRGEVIDLCKIGPIQATRLLSKLVEQGQLRKKGTRKTAVYERGTNL